MAGIYIAFFASFLGKDSKIFHFLLASCAREHPSCCYLSILFVEQGQRRSLRHNLPLQCCRWSREVIWIGDLKVGGLIWQFTTTPLKTMRTKNGWLIHTWHLIEHRKNGRGAKRKYPSCLLCTKFDEEVHLLMSKHIPSQNTNWGKMMFPTSGLVGYVIVPFCGGYTFVRKMLFRRFDVWAETKTLVICCL